MVVPMDVPLQAGMYIEVRDFPHFLGLIYTGIFVLEIYGLLDMTELQ